MRPFKVEILFIFVLLLMLLISCSEKSTTIGDLYLESWTTLEAYIHGKYHYIPTNKEITVTTQKDETQLKIIAAGSVNDRKMVFQLSFENRCLFKNSPCFRGANREFDALKKCVDKIVRASSAPNSCSFSSLITGGEKGSIVRDRSHAPHMDVWVSDVGVLGE